MTSDVEDDENYITNAVPQQKPIINLKSGINLHDLEDGVDFEIEDVLNEEFNRSCEVEPALLDDDENDEDYLSEIMSRHNPIKASSKGDNDENEGGDVSFESLKKQMNDITCSFLPQDKCLLYKRVLEDPPNTDALIADSGLVTVHYSAYLEGQDEPFDSTRKRKVPHNFRIGDCTTLPGLELGIKTMRVQERAQFLVDHLLAYGECGLVQMVPPKSWVLFDVTLMDCVTGDAVDEVEQHLSAVRHSSTSTAAVDEQSSPVDIQLRLKAAKQALEMGNSRYKIKKYGDALRYYKRAETFVSKVGSCSDEEEDACIKLWAKTKRSTSKCLFYLAKYGSCISSCMAVLAYFPHDPLSNLLKGQCFMLHPERRNLKEAIRCFRKGLEGSPNSTSLVTELNKALKEQYEEEQAALSTLTGQKTTFEQGMKKYFGGGDLEIKTENGNVGEDKTKTSKQNKFRSLRENFKLRTDQKLKMVSDGDENSRCSFATFAMTEPEYSYVKSAAVNDYHLQIKETGIGDESALEVFKQ